MAVKGKELKFEIINHIGVVSESATSGWKTEVNRISWDGNEPKYDIRIWNPEHTKMGKGITLTEEELISLTNILVKEVEFLKEE